MNQTDSLFLRSATGLLGEVMEGPPGQWAFVLNPGDRGLLGQLETIDARQASATPTGKSSIAAHTDHVLYGLTLLNRWAAGEENPFASADWSASWQRVTATEAQWRDLRDRLGREAKTWQQAMAARQEWDDTTAAGALASVVHAAYHLGAIRQMLAAQKAESL